MKAYFPLLVKLGAMASIASVLARSSSFKSLLDAGEPHAQSAGGACPCGSPSRLASSVAIRVFSSSYPAADLGLEGSLIAGILGGYVTGLISGVLISIPAMLNPAGAELLTMPLLAAVGVLGGVLRDLRAQPEEIWRFTPFFDLNIYRFFKESRNHRRTAFHLEFSAGILVAEFLRQRLGEVLPARIFFLTPEANASAASTLAAIYAATAVRGRHPAQDLEQHAQRKEARGTGAPAGRGAAGRAHQPDQSALPLQYAELASRR